MKQNIHQNLMQFSISLLLLILDQDQEIISEQDLYQFVVKITILINTLLFEQLQNQQKDKLKKKAQILKYKKNVQSYNIT